MFPDKFTVLTRRGVPIIRTDSRSEAERYASKIHGKIIENEH